ncbi:LacI family DNA-binding transcriptional regulator [Streptomyces sp. CB03238]|uniref:LacI family DNA-binding transcriptional regulator n=1 Tax=Streptomyces sp. CB03238 TaxID=1907777 RepID=UPI000A1013D1|nr:LacI family DNA-binding transcriptional regulator [Streptomyces sp. CB03238]ORT59990.1 LacI family transcriptional regulator [Streptomyces sp. CB03238]
MTASRGSTLGVVIVEAEACVHHPDPAVPDPAPHRAPGPGGPRPTSRDVARVAGVSQATVSLVLGDKWRGRVSERTARLVREAADELGYRPNLAARNLRLGRTRTALLVVPALTNEFFARVYTGAAAVAARHGFGVVLYPSPEGVGPARDPFASARAALDGVIASSMAADALRAIRGTDLPLVMLDSDPADPGAAAHVNLDIADGMRQVTDHLLALGHRRFLHLSSAVPSWTFDVRGRALAACLGGVPDVSVRTAAAPLEVNGAREAAERALTAPGPRPTALVCDDDIVAAGACKAVRRLGLRVPEDVSVTGFDDLALATAVEPELTTVRLPAERIGERGMAALLDVLAGRPPERGDLPVTLMPRGSSGPPPAP